MEGLYSLEAGGEALKLAMRVFWYLDTFPGAVAGAQGPGEPAGEGAEAGPVATALPYRRIVLGDA